MSYVSEEKKRVEHQTINSYFDEKLYDKFKYDMVLKNKFVIIKN